MKRLEYSCRLCHYSSSTASEFNHFEEESHHNGDLSDEFECADATACLARRSCETCGKAPYKHSHGWTDNFKEKCGKRICDECSHKFKYSPEYEKAFNKWFTQMRLKRSSQASSERKISVVTARRS